MSEHDWDRERDYRKHEPRLSDPRPDRALLTRDVTTALEVAVLVQSLPLDKAAALIEQYARTVAAGVRLDRQQSP